ncbi:kinase-like domain-containing protein, partial [Dioszegia hungarica]
MRIPGRAPPSSRGIEGLSFTAAGATLSPDPPLASRHALFSHHRVVSSPSAPVAITGPEPPSPSLSSTSSAFSPASAFLSRFSSTSSSKPLPAASPDGSGSVVLGYTLGKVLGRGGFSTVRLATNARGEQYACKIVKRDDLSDRSGSLEKFEEEIRILQSLPRHPSLLPLLEMERSDYATFLITPAMLGGNLLDVLRREGGSDRTARKWFPGVVDAVAAMHEGYEGFSGGMLHGDLKLDNFLVDHDGRVVVCDFYMAQIITNTTVPPPVRRPRASVPTHLEPIGLPPHFPSASLPYAPPELLSHPPTPPCLAQDIWALGVVLYALLTGKLPFVDAFDPRLQQKILLGRWEVP